MPHMSSGVPNLPPSCFSLLAYAGDPTPPPRPDRLDLLACDLTTVASPRSITLTAEPSFDTMMLCDFTSRCCSFFRCRYSKASASWLVQLWSVAAGVARSYACQVSMGTMRRAPRRGRVLGLRRRRARASLRALLRPPTVSTAS